MIVLRNKAFAQQQVNKIPKPGETIDPGKQPQLPKQGDDNSQEVTAKDLQLEQMKLQRQQIQIQHQRQQLLAKEQMAKARNMTQLQKMENEKEQSENKDRIRTRQQEVVNQKPDNTALYKTKSKAVQPVAMPK